MELEAWILSSFHSKVWLALLFSLKPSGYFINFFSHHISIYNYELNLLIIESFYEHIIIFEWIYKAI